MTFVLKVYKDTATSIVGVRALWCVDAKSRNIPCDMCTEGYKNPATSTLKRDGSTICWLESTHSVLKGVTTQWYIDWRARTLHAICSKDQENKTRGLKVRGPL